MLLLMFTFLAWQGIAPLLREDPESARLIAYAGAAVVAGIVAVALFILKPQVPERTPGQSVEQFWATPKNVQKAQLLWFILEGAAALGSISFALTAQPLVWVVTALAVVTFWLNGPAALTRPR